MVAEVLSPGSSALLGVRVSRRELGLVSLLLPSILLPPTPSSHPYISFFLIMSFILSLFEQLLTHQPLSRCQICLSVDATTQTRPDLGESISSDFHGTPEVPFLTCPPRTGSLSYWSAVHSVPHLPHLLAFLPQTQPRPSFHLAHPALIVLSVPGVDTLRSPREILNGRLEGWWFSYKVSTRSRAPLRTCHCCWTIPVSWASTSTV